ncbi:helicase domain protein [Thermocrinis albus DSM 14484]|uniref:Helicase domain protein n=1 Tax=Thermocrinis albus (strain DSM 14484 / JCM 11386 / HI 11/12) TaxID=638303 RepID=D3SN88_THEAH|nr:DUF3883 domain-containing protein [Thermocrinis albus]ADC90218.1 helicase domain protein [Thermocrinis albus DSM 14484]
MLKKGDIIKGPFWSEPIKVIEVREKGDHVNIKGFKVNSKQYIDDLLTKDQLDQLEILASERDFSADPENVFLALEAVRFKHASLFDPFLAMNVSRIDPLPFQIEAVYGYVLKQPRIRFLIADDPGAGKTIMAGLILKELKLRNLVKKVLIIVPGHLKDQWKRELKEKFNETLVEINRETLESHYGENPWERYDQVITSMDFAKQEDIVQGLNYVHWDLVIVDEAHKLSAYNYGGKISKTQRYKLGEVISKNSTHLLFLTATPHRGDPENFRLFLDLLVPGFFATQEMVEESIKNKDNPLFIRRLKEDLRDFEGKPIFPGRRSTTIKFRLSDPEKELYNEVSRYVREQYGKALKDENNRNVAFALAILQRRMASSTYALLRSLERRKNKLEKLLKGEEKRRGISAIDYYEVDDLEEGERWKREEEWESVTLARDVNELKAEINKLGELIQKAEKIVKSEKEVKLSELKTAIEKGFEEIRKMGGNPKILIFTESRDTLEYLVKKISGWGYTVNYIHGDMTIDERIKEEKRFRDETQIMVATEAAGEGINLQFCHIMINYDIPWNPNRLEQRMGRIHRYGQQKDVHIFNLVAEDTIEGQVLVKLFEKLEEIKEKLGSDKVFDIIGDVFKDKNLYELIIEAITNTRTMEDILKELDIKIDEEYIKKIKEALGESLATKHIDYTRIRETAERAREFRLIPEYVRAFFEKAFQKAGGKYTKKKGDFISIDSIPYEIRSIAETPEIKNAYGQIMKSYRKVTFDKDLAFKNPDAEFITFGHPLFEAVLKWVSEKFRDELRKGAVFKDPSGKLNGYIWFYTGEVKDGKGEVAGRKIIAIYDDGNTLREINPSVLWDLSPYTGNFESEPFDSEKREEEVKDFVIEVLENYKKEIQEERNRQAQIKRKYGLNSLDYLISQLDTELTELYERSGRGEKVDLAIRNKEDTKKRYEEAKRNLEEEIKREQSLSITMPELLSVVRIIPEKGQMVESEEIERIGMQVAMDYERKNGRNPEDVSKDNRGYDILSTDDKGEVRYIEVKARAQMGEIVLTRNEWFKASQLKDKYWLYIVVNAATKPQLYIINNPAQKLQPEEKVEVVRYVVPPDEWLSKKQEVWKE